MVIQTSQTQEIKQKLNKILDELEELKNELKDNIYGFDYDELKEDLNSLVYSIYTETLEINKIVFNRYADMYLDRPAAGPVDVSEDIEESYIRDFIDFITHLRTYNVEQLYNYIREEYMTKDEEENGE